MVLKFCPLLRDAKSYISAQLFPHQPSEHSREGIFFIEAIRPLKKKKKKFTKGEGGNRHLIAVELRDPDILNSYL